jgi:hypothetical protein
LIIQTIGYSFINYWTLLPNRIWTLCIFPFTILKRRRNRQIYAAQKLPFFINLCYPPIIFLSHLLDLCGFPEQLDLFFSIIKPKSRRLTKKEYDHSYLVFGKKFPYKKVLIDEDSWFAQKGAKYSGAPSLGMGLVLFRVVNFNRSIDESKKTDLAWLIHELTHVKQMQTIGSAYIFESLIAQHYLGYALPKTNPFSTIPLNELNIEQQAEVSKYFFLDEKIEDSPFYQQILAIRQGKFN